MEGWIKLHRQIVDSRCFSNEGLFKVWIWCLLKANHKKNWVDIKTGRGETEVEVLPGQFIFGRNIAAKELKMKPSTVNDRMKKLEKMQNLVMQPNTHFSLISIVNWDSYQKKDCEDQQPIRQPSNNQPTGNQQPSDTNKKDKKEKNEKKENIPDLKSGSDNFYITKKKKKLTGRRLETFLSFWEAFDYKYGKADAADSWLNIPTLTGALVDEILSAAKIEAVNRRTIINNGGSPKWAQGWIAARRWEDESYRQVKTDKHKIIKY